MSSEWDDVAASWDTDPGPSIYAAAAFSSLEPVLVRHGVTLDGARVLDFGCGTGLLTEHLARTGATVIAVDSSAEMLKILDDKIGRHGWPGVLTRAGLPDPPGQFDLVVCSSVCAFLDDYPAAVVDLTNQLRSGGLFVQWDWERTVDIADHGLSRDEIRGALSAAGLDLISVDVGFSIEVDDMTMAPLMGSGRRR